MRRSLSIAGAAVALVLSALSPAVAQPSSRPSSPPPSSTTQQQTVHRAEASYAALQKYFAVDDGSGLYHETVPAQSDDPTYSYEWPFSQAHVAAMTLSGMPGRAGARYLPELKRHVASQEHYWSTKGTTGVPGYASGAMPPYGEGGDFFYDDNEWVGLAFVQRYLMYGDDSSLGRAKQIFALVDSAWDDDTSHAAPGGTFWTQAPWSQDRNTVSNMPGAMLGLRLYLLTHDEGYLTKALRMYRWTNRYLQRPDGLYHDNLKLDGTVDETIWSYNQGVPIAVDVLLAQATGDKSYLREARRVANASFRYFVKGGRLGTQPPYFNSIYFKDLLLLGSRTGAHDTRVYRDALAAYADDLWQHHRDKATGLFHTRSGNDGASTEMIEQAAAVQVFALLAWSPQRYDEIS